MRLDRSLALARARLRARFGSAAGDQRVPVLMYHSVSDDDESGVRPYYKLAISPKRFLEHMRWLADLGLRATGVDPILAGPGGASRETDAVITFDDGYVDFLEYAWPELERRGFGASVFLPTSFIGSAGRRRFKGRECLTWDEVRDLARRGVTFGSHTVTHAALHGMAWGDVRAELRESRQTIERETGGPVTTFAYPFAFPQQDSAFVARLRAELREQGYRACVTTIIGRHAPGDDLLTVKRLPINGGDDLHLFAAKLDGAYDWVGTLQSAWKRIR